MNDDNALRRWFAVEMGKMLETFVARPRPLHELLRLERPSVPTRGGDEHVFDKDALRAFADALPALTRVRVRLPLTFHVDHEAAGDAYAADPDAIEALRDLRLTNAQPRDGRLWVSAPLAREFSRRYPTLVQFVFH